jgi:hypothetical protein
MKGFLAGLLLLNLVLLAWSWWQVEPELPTGMAPIAAVTAGPGLVLLQELETPLAVRHETAAVAPASPPESEPSPALAEPVVDIAAAVPEAVAAAPAVACLRVAGFESEAVAGRVAEALRQDGGDVRRLGEEVGVTTRFWVMLPPAKSAAAAVPLLERLQRAGVKDFYLIRNGENVNAISLGVYSAKASAQRRVEQLRRLKLTPRIEEITLPRSRWWLELEWPAEKTEDAWRRLLPAEMHNVMSLPCQ